MGGGGGKIEVGLGVGGLGLGGFVRVEEREVGVCNNGLFIYIHMSASQPASQAYRDQASHKETHCCSRQSIGLLQVPLCFHECLLFATETRLDLRKTARRENKAKKIRHGIEYNAFVFSIFPSPLRLEVRTMVLSHVDCLDGALGYERK